jgi:hypothetical protein
MRLAFFTALAWLAFSAAPAVAQIRSGAPDSTRAPDPWSWRGAPPSEEATLQIFQVGRDSAKGRSRVLYKALALGLSPGERVALWSFPLGLLQGTCMQSGFEVDSTGRVACGARAVGDSCTACTLPLDQIVLSATGYAPGEPYRVGVISADGKARVYAQAFPFPVEAASDSLHARLEMLTPDALEYQIVGEGFPEGETVGVTTRSVDRSMSSKIVVPAGGLFRLFVLPQVPAHAGGFVTVVLQSGKHQLTLGWPWGESARAAP